MKKPLLFLLLTAGSFAGAQSTNEPSFKRTEDVIYGRKFGTALTLDLFQPEKPNGAGIVFMVSGGWFSAHEAINPGWCRPFLDRGYFIHSNTPPILILHGDADKLVPIFQAEQFVKRCKELGVEAKLVVREGKQHGWTGIEKDVPIFA